MIVPTSAPPLWMIVAWAIPVAIAVIFIVMRYRHNERTRKHNAGVAEIIRSCRTEARDIFRDG